MNAEGCCTYMWYFGHLLPAGRTSRQGSSRWGHLHVTVFQRHSQLTKLPRH